MKLRGKVLLPLIFFELLGQSKCFLPCLAERGYSVLPLTAVLSHHWSGAKGDRKHF